MAKTPKSAADQAQAHPDSNTLSPLSVHQIWLAGLGAMAQAQAQGNKAFETLVSDGLAFQRQTQDQARQRFEETTQQLTHMAQGLREQTVGRMDRLEQVFEERVARALHRLGIPSLQDLAELQARLADLEARLPQAAAPARSRKAASTPAAAAPKAARTPRRSS